MKSTEGTVHLDTYEDFNGCTLSCLIPFPQQRRFIEKGNSRDMIDGFVSRIIASTWGVVDF